MIARVTQIWATFTHDRQWSWMIADHIQITLSLNSVACYLWTNVYKKHWVYDVTVVINERKLRGSNFQKHNYHIWWWPEEDGPAFNDLVVTEAYPAQRATRKSKKEKFKKVFILFCFFQNSWFFLRRKSCNFTIPHSNKSKKKCPEIASGRVWTYDHLVWATYQCIRPLCHQGSFEIWK